MRSAGGYVSSTSPKLPSVPGDQWAEACMKRRTSGSSGLKVPETIIAFSSESDTNSFVNRYS